MARSSLVVIAEIGYVVVTLSAAGMATPTTVPPASAECDADLDLDGLVNGADLGLLLSFWGTPSIADLNQDGNTDGADLGMLLAAWGPCP